MRRPIPRRPPNGEEPPEAQAENLTRDKISLPRGNRMMAPAEEVPKILLPISGKYVSKFGEELGEILRDKNFYTLAGSMVWFKYNEERGVEELDIMEAYTFRSVIEKYCRPYVFNIKRKMNVCKTMSFDIAKSTLVCPDFLGGLRLLSAINNIQLPTKEDEMSHIELLPEGYDPKTHILTLSTLRYDLNMPVKEARAFIRQLYEEFPYEQTTREHSITVSVAAMLTLYCRHLLPSHALRPIFVWDANRTGAGKTLCAKIAMIPVLGHCPIGTLPNDEAEIRKNIATAVKTGASILCYDNVRCHVESSALESLTTSSEFRDRQLGSNTDIMRRHGLTVLMTGNGCTFSPDLRRRMFISTLFLQGRAEGRQIKRPLSEEMLMKLRPKMLSALWALVRSWDEAGMPVPRTQDNNLVEWSQNVGGILEHNGFMDLYDTKGVGSVYGGDDHPTADMSTAQDRQDLERLVMLMQPGMYYRMLHIVQLAAKNGLFQRITPEGKNKTIGVLISRWKGRIIGNRRLDVIEDPTTRSRNQYVVREVEEARS
jgi:hypothetical protein